MLRGEEPVCERNETSGRQLADDRVEESRGSGAGGGELRFQQVREGHQLIHFGHDPALFGEGWERNGQTFQLGSFDSLGGYSSSVLVEE